MHHRSPRIAAVLKSVVARRYLVQVAITGLFAILLAAGFTTNVALASHEGPDADDEPDAEMYCDGYTYVVEQGNTLSEIANYYETTVYSLAYANNISDPNHIYKGMELCIVDDYDENDDRDYVYTSDDDGDDAEYSDDEYGYDERGDAEYSDDEYGYDERGDAEYSDDEYDEYGYDAEGYNEEGYNEEGYDRYGYNRYGYNKDGYKYSSDGYYYVVKKGDTLSEIAKYHDVSLYELAYINDISNPNQIYPGMELHIP